MSTPNIHFFKVYSQKTMANLNTEKKKETSESESLTFRLEKR